MRNDVGTVRGETRYPPLGTEGEWPCSRRGRACGDGMRGWLEGASERVGRAFARDDPECGANAHRRQSNTGTAFGAARRDAAVHGLRPA